MPVVRLPFGEKYLEAEIPEPNLLGVLMPKTGGEKVDETLLVREALARPTGTGTLAELAKGRDNAVIVISDVTRMAPSVRFLPYLLAGLAEGGISEEKVKVIIGLGNHRPVTEDEKKTLIGEQLYGRVKCIHSKEAGFGRIGYTRRGTPVEVCRTLLEADLKICSGNIEYHRLSGFSGGAKAIMAGVAGKEAITHNHAMSDLPGVEPGKLDGNPVREDMEEFARMVGVDFLFNVVTDELGRIVGAYAGDLVAAHWNGCKHVERLYRIVVEKPGDIVVVSPGGYPKDSSVYQSQKGLLNALDICKPGGTVIVTARCAEGYGDEVFARWMEEAADPTDVRKNLQKEFVLGGHKARSVLQAIEKAHIEWISEIPDRVVRKLFYNPAGTPQEAIRKALARHGANASIWVMPYGGLCLPIVDSGESPYK